MTISSTPLRLGSVAPDFKCDTSKGPMDSFHAFKQGRWAILFSHPDDFTPVCTTGTLSPLSTLYNPSAELGQVAKLAPEWQNRNVVVIGLSCNDVSSHHGWIKDIEYSQGCTVQFPIIADPTREIATMYGMLDYQDPTNRDTKGMPFTVRSVFFIDPKNVIRTMITYPASTGRNFDEIVRVLDSLMLCDEYPIATPVNWKKGDDVIVHVGLSDEEAAKKFQTVKKTGLKYLRYANVSN